MKLSHWTSLTRSRLTGWRSQLRMWSGPGIPRISRYGVTTGLHGLDTPLFQPLSDPWHGAHMPFRACADDLTNQRRGMAHSHPPPRPYLSGLNWRRPAAESGTIWRKMQPGVLYSILWPCNISLLGRSVSELI